LRYPDNPLSAFRSSTESSTHRSRLGEVNSTSSTSLAVSTPSTSSWFQAATQREGNQPPLCCPRSVSHALRALIRPEPAGLVSCRSRPWGSTLQGSSHPRSRTSSRTPLPSCGYPDLWLLHHPFALPGYPGGIPFKHRHIGDATPWKPGPTSRPCSPRASVLMAGGLDRFMSRDPHGLCPP
jgi:hypothetical protein